MTKIFEIADETIRLAQAADHGRHAELLISDGLLRQSVLALSEGTVLAEHNSPPAGSIQVLKGRIRVTGEEPSTLDEGQLVVLTHFRHAVEALEDSAFLLTTVTSVIGQGSYSKEPPPKQESDA